MFVGKKAWLVCGLIYALFFYWYTSFSGPLTDDEIDHCLTLLSEGQGRDPQALAMIEKFMREDTGDDFVMLNVIDMYPEPLQVEGVEAGETSADVLGKYMEYMYPALFARACHPVFFGTAANSAMDLMNAPGMENWTTGAGMRYRSRRDMLDIVTNPAFQGSHDFKVAAMRKTIAFPMDPWMQLGDPRLVLALLLALIASLLGGRGRGAA